MESNRLTILMCPLNEYGHVNPCIGIAKVLQKRGHRIVCAIPREWKGELIKYGFEEQLFTDKSNINKRPSEDIQKFMLNNGVLNNIPLLEKMRLSLLRLYTEVKSKHHYYNFQIKLIINRVKPDLIVVDSWFTIMPAFAKGSYRWITYHSANPLSLFDNEQMPPPYSGNK